MTLGEDTPRTRVDAHLQAAASLRRQGALADATRELEAALGVARQAPYQIAFDTRVQLALQLADDYVEADARPAASALLDEEREFVERVRQMLERSGTPDQLRSVMTGRRLLGDRATQIALLGEPAPEIEVQAWVMGEPATLASLRGRVVLIEFWATWCAPCLSAFARLRELHESYAARGLDILALTRYYAATRGTAASPEEELDLIRKTVAGRGLEIRVGVCADDSTQRAYGATGMPTLVLVDRRGRLRYAHFGGESARFESLLVTCLDEPSADVDSRS